MAKHLSSPKFKLFFNLWLYTAGGTKLFYMSHRHLLQSSMFCMFALAQRKTKNPYSTLTYRDLFLCSRKTRPRKFREMQRQNITQLRKIGFAHVSGLKFTLMCHREISQHQTRVGLNVPRIKAKANHYLSYKTFLENEGNKIYRLKGFFLNLIDSLCPVCAHVSCI